MTVSALPPKLPPTPQKSFFHQAATTSVFAPLIALGVTFLSVGARAGLDPQSQRTLALTVSIVASIFMLIGLICGIIALFGIPKYGKKGILGKALAGILFPLLLTVMAVLPRFLQNR